MIRILGICHLNWAVYHFQVVTGQCAVKFCSSVLPPGDGLWVKNNIDQCCIDLTENGNSITEFTKNRSIKNHKEYCKIETHCLCLHKQQYSDINLIQAFLWIRYHHEGVFSDYSTTKQFLVRYYLNSFYSRAKSKGLQYKHKKSGLHFIFLHIMFDAAQKWQQMATLGLQLQRLVCY